MENKTEVHTIQPSLLWLNDDCHLQIFEFLELNDSINLAESCSRLKFVAGPIFKKYSKFQLDSRIINKGDQYIDLVFSYIGQYVSSLKVDYFRVSSDLSKIFGKINKECKNLKCLGIWNVKASEFVLSPFSFDNVEILSLSYCNADFGNSFLKKFDKLTCLSVDRLMESNDFKIVLKNNPNIESFVGLRSYFNIQLLDLIPNVERLSVRCGNINHLNKLLYLNRLKKLRLYCDGRNITDFLRVLARKRSIEEIDLNEVKVDQLFFDILQSFDKLQLLVIDSIRLVKLNSSIALPTTLKHLRLFNFELKNDDFIATIQPLHSIERIDVRECSITADNHTYVNDFMRLSQQIIYAVEHRTQRVEVILPNSVLRLPRNDPSEECLFDAERLRTPNRYKYCPIEIKIDFPGCDDFL